MESKESPFTPTEKSQSNVPTVPESLTSNVESESPVTQQPQPILQQHPSTSPALAPQPLMQKELPQMHGRGQEIRSQDVRRQYYPQQSGQQMPTAVQPLNELPETAVWNRAAASNVGYENEYLYRNEVPSPNAPQAQQLHGRGDLGPMYRGPANTQQMRGPPRIPAGQHPAQRSRYEYAADESYPQPLMSQRLASNASWEDYPANGPQNWNMPDERMAAGGMQRPSNNRAPYRGDSRGNSESESGWYASQQQAPMPHQRRNDPNGWNYSINDYEGYHRGGQAGANRSRTASNSYGDEYEQGMYPPPYSADNDRRYKTRSKPPAEEQPYDYPEEYDRQKVCQLFKNT